MTDTEAKPVAYLARKRNPSSGPLMPAFLYAVIPATAGAGETSVHTRLGDAIKRVKREGWTPESLPPEEGIPEDTIDLVDLEWLRVRKAFKPT